MNDIFYNPPLPPLLVRGISGIHFFESILLSKINVGLEKNQQINSNVPLPGGAQGWVNNKSIYLLIFLGLKH